MSKKYKLTTQDLKTRKGEYNETQWQVGVMSPELSGEGDLCGEGWYHYYHDPLLAVFMNPAHANVENPICWEVSAQGKHIDDNGVKGGCTKLKLVKEIHLPEVSKTQRVAFAILCTKEVYKDVEWNKWADNWLDGSDRSYAAAEVAALVARAAYADAYAAYAAASAAYAASYAAARAVAYAARNAAEAAYAANAWTFKKLLKIANEAMKY